MALGSQPASQAVSARDSVGRGWDSGTGDGQGKAVKIIRYILNKVRTGVRTVDESGRCVFLQ